MQTSIPSTRDFNANPVVLQYDISTKPATDGNVHTYLKLTTVENATQKRVLFSTYLLNITRTGDNNGKPIVQDYFQSENGTLVIDIVHGKGQIMIVGNHEPILNAWRGDPNTAIIIRNFPFEDDASYEVQARLIAFDYPTNLQPDDKTAYAHFTFKPNTQEALNGQVRLVPEFPTTALETLAVVIGLVAIFGRTRIFKPN